MAYFAEIDKKGVVLRVIVADQEFINSGLVGSANNWVETELDTTASKKTILRKHYAGIGYTYDKTLDAFIPPKPYNSWVLDTDTATWKAPVEKPTDSKAKWNEELQIWEVKV